MIFLNAVSLIFAQMTSLRAAKDSSPEIWSIAKQGQINSEKWCKRTRRACNASGCMSRMRSNSIDGSGGGRTASFNWYVDNARV